MVLCVVCTNNESKYKCPQCSIEYCSVSCYSKHGDCTEKFYKKQVEETLQSTIVNEEEKMKTIEMLERLRIQELEEEEDIIEEQHIERMNYLLTRLQSGENPDNIWFSLMEEEKEEFWKIIESGELGNNIITDDMLIPWYCKSSSNGLILDIKDNNNNNNNIPTIINDIPLLSTLLSNNHPSDLLKYNFIEIIYVYCFCTRLYVGQWTNENQIEILESILRLSRALNPIKTSDSFTSFTSIKLVLQSVLELSIIPPFCNTRQFSIEIIKDIICILEYKHRCLLLLSHLYNFLDSLMKYQKPKSTGWKRIGKIKYKIWFYLSWVNFIDSNILLSLIPDLKEQYKYYYLRYININTTKISKPSILSTNIKHINTQESQKQDNIKSKEKKLLIEEL